MNVRMHACSKSALLLHAHRNQLMQAMAAAMTSTPASLHHGLASRKTL